MERENPLERSDALGEEQLFALFKQVEAPQPPADFVTRTMRAVKREPLAPGRTPLRDPLASLLGWAALVAGVSLSALMVAVSHPLFGSMFTTLIGRGVSAGVWLMQFRRTALALLEICATTGLAVARAAATTEGTAGLALMAVVGAVSLSALHRLLMTEREDSQWQELA
jgi:hypothetical protein